MKLEQFTALLDHNRPFVLDGALGTMLIAQGLPSGYEPVRWNIEHPERVSSVHANYAASGSELVHANTFGGNRARLAASGIAHLIGQVNAAGIAIATSAVGGLCLVAGDIGPTGLLFPPAGTATIEELQDVFQEQTEILAASGADVLSVETMYDLREALAAIDAARKTDLPVLASMTFDVKRRGFFTMMGDSLLPSLLRLADSGAVAVGMNCSVTSDVMVRMVEEVVRQVPVPLAVQPNAGQPRVTATGIVYGAVADSFAEDIRRMTEAGARLVGGCCGSTPEFIQAIRVRFPKKDGAP